MTYGIARPATSPELDLFDTPGKKSRYYTAIKPGRVIYTARVNQVITSWDGLQSVIFDTGSGTLANVFPDMIILVGTTAGARDVGWVRLRGHDSTHFYFEQYSGIKILDNQYITVVDDFKLLQRAIKIDGDTVLMDGTVTYTDQHAKPDPTPIMGGHRVVEMTGDSVDVDFDFSQSYVIDGSSIASRSTTAPTAASISGATTTTPTVTFDEFGWHNVYHNLVATNGKEFFGVRYVFVWDKDHLPPRVKVNNPVATGNVNAGGYESEIELYRNADIDIIHPGDFAILFSIDWWGDTEESIGPVAGSENIEMWGWIASPESIVQNPERGSVHFSVQGPHYWMQKVSAYPAGVEFSISAPTDWEHFQGLTIDKGVWHFVHWRSTLTRICDFFPCGDTRYSGEVSSLSQNLWAQLQEMTALQILARPGFNALGQLFIEINPNLIPTADRDFSTVMDITKSDWIGELDFDHVTLDEVCQVNMSGVAVDGGGNGLSYFALAPGGTYNHYGNPDVFDKLLASSQDEVIQLAGLYFSWRNNTLPNIPMTLKANNRLVDIFPNSKCTTTIAPSDNVRGVGFSGGLMPESVTVNFDDTTGRATRTVEFRTETHESLAIKETVPGSGDVSTLPGFKFPPLPIFTGGSLPGGSPTTIDGPPKVLIHDIGVGQRGLLYTENFNTLAPDWYQVNAGLTTTQFQTIRKVQTLPSGALYVAEMFHPTPANSFLAYAARPGLPFTVLLDQAGMIALFGVVDAGIGLATLSTNPLSGEFAFTLLRAGDNVKWYQGTGIAYTLKSSFSFNLGSQFGDATYGLGKWLLTNGFWMTLSPAGVPTGGSGTVGSNISRHIRAGTTGKTYHYPAGDDLLVIGADNDASIVGGVGDTTLGISNDEEMMATDSTGQFIMTRSSTGTPIASDDFGTSWRSMAGTPPTGIPPLVVHKYFCINAQEWIAAAGSVYYTRDRGFTWSERKGNLTTICPLLECNSLKVIGL